MAFRGRIGLPCGKAVKRSQERAAVEGVAPQRAGPHPPGTLPRPLFPRPPRRMG